MDDWRLLREYLEHGSEAGFTELVNRYVGLVYSVALRRLANPQDAEEVAQRVFCQFARKARRLRSDTVIVGWLHQAACLEALAYLRSDRRRRQRETEVALMNPTETESSWQQLGPFLDEALGQIDEPDRVIILRRFFQRQSLREVGGSIGVTEDAARMRVNRALEKLRELLGKKGIACSAAGLAGVLAAETLQAAPAAVAQSVQGAVLAVIQAGGGASFSTLLSLMAKAKLKTAALAALALVTAGVALHFQWIHHAVLSLTEPSAAETSLPAAMEMPAVPVADPLIGIRAAWPENPALPDLIARLRSVLREEPVEENGVVSSERLFAALKAFGADLPAAIPVLLEGLQDPNNTVKMTSQWGFLRLGRYAREAIPPLLALVRDENQPMATRSLAMQSVRALATQDEGAAVVAEQVPDLIELLKSDRVRVQVEATRVLQQLAASGPYARDAIPALIELLTYSASPEVARAEALNPPPSGSDEVVEAALQAEMKNLTRDVRVNAIYALASSGPDARDAVPRLTEFLTKDSALNVAAAQALRRIGPEAREAVPLLRERLNDRATDIQLEAAMALWAIAGQTDGTADVLAKSIYPHRDDSRYSLQHKIRVLGEMGSGAQVAVTNLVKLCQRATPEVRTAVLAALNRIDPAAAATVPPSEP